MFHLVEIRKVFGVSLRHTQVYSSSRRIRLGRDEDFNQPDKNGDAQGSSQFVLAENDF